MRQKAGVTTLRARREELCDKFSAKCIKSDRFRAWFPEKNNVRSTRKTEKYLESFARCERLKRSPLFYMR